MGNNGWISTKEKLPDNNKYVLVFTKHKEILTGAFHDDWVDISGYFTGSSIDDILYWQPLPEPPIENS